jgi:YggT family protein
VGIRDLIVLALTLYFYAVFAWVILSWIPVSATHPLAKVQVFLDRIIHPVIRPIRKVVPPIRLGGGALDLSPIVLLIGIQIIIALF